MTSFDTPRFRWACRGPGETIRWVGLSRAISSDRDLVVPKTSHLQPAIDLAQPLDEVVGEGVVVIDQDESWKAEQRAGFAGSLHFTPLSTLTPALSQRERGQYIPQETTAAPGFHPEPLCWPLARFATRWSRWEIGEIWLLCTCRVAI